MNYAVMKMTNIIKLQPLQVERELDVITAWDLGLDDCVAIIFCQIFDQEIRIVDYLADFGHGMPFYVKYLADWEDRHKISFSSHFARSDARTKGASEVTKWEIAASMGINFSGVEKCSDRSTADELLCNFLPKISINSKLAGGVAESLSERIPSHIECAENINDLPIRAYRGHIAKAVITLIFGLKVLKFVSIDNN